MAGLQSFGITASTIRWRWPRHKTRHDFKEGDAVVIARLFNDGMTTTEIIGHRGVIVELFDESLPFEFLVDMKCGTCQGTHTMADDELDLLASPYLTILEDKAGIIHELPDPCAVARAEFEDQIALALHAEGLRRISVRNHTGLHMGPQVPKPKWQKMARFSVDRLEEMRAVADKVLRAAQTVGGMLWYWEMDGPDGFRPVTDDVLDHGVLNMNFQAIIRSCD